MSRMTDERLALLRTAWHGHNDALTELIDALLAERAEVERLRTRMHVLDRQRWCKCSMGVAEGSDGWTLDVPETDDAAADLRLLLGMEDGK